MRLDEYIEELEPDEAADRRRLAEEKSYEILDYLDDFEQRFESVTRGDAWLGSTSPSIFIGRSSYPTVSTGILSPVGEEDRADEFATSGDWYHQGLAIERILQYRTGLLNSNRAANVHVEDVWDGFVGVGREVAIADRPVDVEIDLVDTPNLDLSIDDVTTPTGPRATADAATLAENPHVPRAIKRTLRDTDWSAQGAMVYLYRRGFDVYAINDVLSAGALGRDAQRRLVPTRWSITAVDDAISQYLRGRIRNNPTVDTPKVYVNEYIGNRYWVVLVPGQWEFELVEMKTPGSVWNPDPAGGTWLASAHEGFEGRSSYVSETAGAYYAARLGVLEHLHEDGRQAKCLVLREVSDDYWAPVGVWQIRESVRNAFNDSGAEAQTFHDAVRGIVPHLPVSFDDLRRKSALITGIQASLHDFNIKPR